VKVHNRKSAADSGASLPYVCRWSNCSLRFPTFFLLVQHCTDREHFIAETALLTEPPLSNGLEPVFDRAGHPIDLQSSANILKVETESEDVAEQFKVESNWSEEMVSESKHSLSVESGCGANSSAVAKEEEEGEELRGEESVGNICNICLATTQDPANHAR
jgi:hypothetical protein